MYLRQPENIGKYLSILSQPLLLKFISFKTINFYAFDLGAFLKFLKEVKNYLTNEAIEVDYNEMLWTFCNDLKIGCRRVYFYDLKDKVDELFYRIKYEDNEKKRKKENKKRKEEQQIKTKI